MILNEQLTVSMDNIRDLARIVEKDYEQRELELPKLVIIPRSAYIIGDIFSRRWGIAGRNVLHACVEKIEDQTGLVAFEEGQFPIRSQVEGENLLVVDAVCRTGDTLDYVVGRLRSLGANTVESAVLYEKVGRSMDEPAHKPDFFVEKRREFVRFAWEAPEYHQVLSELEEAEVVERISES